MDGIDFLNAPARIVAIELDKTRKARYPAVFHARKKRRRFLKRSMKKTLDHPFNGMRVEAFAACPASEILIRAICGGSGEMQGGICNSWNFGKIDYSVLQFENVVWKLVLNIEI